MDGERDRRLGSEMTGKSHLNHLPAFALVFAVGACTAPEYHWIKAGGDETMYRTDRAACVAYTNEEFNPYYDYGPPGRGGSYAQEAMFRQMAAEDMFRNCMKRRGYRLVEAPPKQQ
jgi:hypothetical protein